MFVSENSINLLGSIIANVNNILLIGIFIARIYKYPKIEYWLGVLFILSIFPLLIMFIKSLEIKKTLIYYIQLLLMVSFIGLELFLDYIFKLDFRQNRCILIPYLILFYASLGGMIGIAGQSGKIWTLVTIITFLVMAAVSMIMHFKTGT